MRTYRFNKALLLFLVTAFLTVQWATAHIHLAEHHDHDGGHHQHDIQAHAHHSSGHHAETVDSAHATGDHDVVELDNECRLPHWNNLGDQPHVASALHEHRLIVLSGSSGVILPEADDSKQSYLTYSTIRLRAPPQLS